MLVFIRCFPAKEEVKVIVRLHSATADAAEGVGRRRAGHALAGLQLQGGRCGWAPGATSCKSLARSVRRSGSATADPDEQRRPGSARHRPRGEG